MNVNVVSNQNMNNQPNFGMVKFKNTSEKGLQRAEDLFVNSIRRYIYASRDNTPERLTVVSRLIKQILNAKNNKKINVILTGNVKQPILIRNANGSMVNNNGHVIGERGSLIKYAKVDDVDQYTYVHKLSDAIENSNYRVDYVGKIDEYDIKGIKSDNEYTVGFNLCTTTEKLVKKALNAINNK